MADPPFSPRLALASLSGESDGAWARAGAGLAGCAFIGGIAVDAPTRAAARAMVTDRDREEFLPADPLAFVDSELDALAAAPLRPGVNVRAASADAVGAVAEVCADHDAILEVNAHCRQAEMCEAGSGEALLRDGARLRRHVAAAASAGVDVSVKVRAEVAGVDLPALARDLQGAGASIVHVDAMDSEGIVAEVVAAAPDLFVVANNGIRDERTAREYLAYGADALSVGRPSDRPAVLRRVGRPVRRWFEDETAPREDDGEVRA